MAEEQQISVTGNVMFYENPVPLSRGKHGKFGVTPTDKPFEFMADQHFLPITAPEFGSAAASFPIIFAGEDRSPLAVMGIRTGENLFIENGVYHTDFYMPAFARRYPFVLANDSNNERFVVCVDEAADCVTDKKPAQSFFEKDDTSQYTKEAFEFLQNFERDRQATATMVEELKRLDLFEPKEMNFQGNNPDGSLAERQKIADYFAISEDKLRALDAETTKSLADRGILAVAYAHLVSLSNWQRLVNMTLRRATAEQEAGKA
ncbi:SapC family protein [Algimonas porphyrae]|uniref:Peptidase n=1 Tax=Algimonas porphyrae TaxID=1128113 RepID=A0ABQ5UZV2_9PROT|nr:SapC family protein [Algimonas porphyrae]GLQ20683.1 peptidase [Algimonas porphyrae]